MDRIVDEPRADLTDGTPDRVELPYASDDPAENVDDPGDLVVENRDDETHVLEVTVRDGDVLVLSRKYKVEAENRRVERNVVARKGVYAVEMYLETAEETTNVEWSVSGSGADLVVAVTEDATLAVESP